MAREGEKGGGKKRVLLEKFPINLNRMSELIDGWSVDDENDDDDDDDDDVQ